MCTGQKILSLRNPQILSREGILVLEKIVINHDQFYLENILQGLSSFPQSGHVPQNIKSSKLSAPIVAT